MREVMTCSGPGVGVFGELARVDAEVIRREVGLKEELVILSEDEHFGRSGVRAKNEILWSRIDFLRSVQEWPGIRIHGVELLQFSHPGVKTVSLEVWSVLWISLALEKWAREARMADVRNKAASFFINLECRRVSPLFKVSII
ncbi:MAG: hypothetical protein AAGC74_14245 [Verrucomicrobiota bacterium]